MRDSVELIDGDCRAVIRVASIDAVADFGGGTAVYFKGGFVSVRQTVAEILQAIDDAEEEVELEQVLLDGWAKMQGDS